MAEYKKILFGV